MEAIKSPSSSAPCLMSAVQCLLGLAVSQVYWGPGAMVWGSGSCFTTKDPCMRDYGTPPEPSRVTRPSTFVSGQCLNGGLIIEHLSLPAKVKSQTMFSTLCNSAICTMAFTCWQDVCTCRVCSSL